MQNAKQDRAQIIPWQPVTRRSAITGLSLAMLSLTTGCAGAIEPDSREDQIDGVADGLLFDTFFYAYGPYEFARTIQSLSGQTDVDTSIISKEALREAKAHLSGGAFLNREIHVTELADETMRAVTAPNNDTLYTSAVLELSRTPVRLTLPKSGSRYLSVAFFDIFTDQAAILGPREHRGRGGEYFVVGPDGVAPKNANVLRLPSNDIWMLARTFVAGPEDLDSARRTQSGITVRAVDETAKPKPFITKAPRGLKGQRFLALTNEVLGRSPGHPQVKRAASFAERGIVPGELDTWDRLRRVTRARWNRVLPRTEPLLKKGLDLQRAAHGWTRPPSILADYGANDLVRAAVALIGFGALRPEDALYFNTAVDGDGQSLDGRNTYAMTLPAGGVPVDAFWSLSLYAPDRSGRLFFYSTPTNRHSVNSRSDNLVRREDGTIELRMSREKPADKSVVWMPLPDGPFEAIFRTYLPEKALLTGQWQVPPITRID
jgi:hypothetical protein